MFIPCDTGNGGIESKFVLNSLEFSSRERLVELLNISGTYYKSRVIRLDVSGYSPSPEDALIILETMASLREDKSISFHTEASKSISYPAAYILFFGDIGHRSLHANTHISRECNNLIGFLAPRTANVSGDDRRMAEMVSLHIKQSAYKRGRYANILSRMTETASELTAQDACKYRFIDVVQCGWVSTPHDDCTHGVVEMIQ